MRPLYWMVCWAGYRLLLIVPIPGTPWWIEKRLLSLAGAYAYWKVGSPPPFWWPWRRLSKDSAEAQADATYNQLCASLATPLSTEAGR